MAKIVDFRESRDKGKTKDFEMTHGLHEFADAVIRTMHTELDTKKKIIDTVIDRFGEATAGEVFSDDLAEMMEGLVLFLYTPIEAFGDEESDPMPLFGGVAESGNLYQVQIFFDGDLTENETFFVITKTDLMGNCYNYSPSGEWELDEYFSMGPQTDMQKKIIETNAPDANFLSRLLVDDISISDEEYLKMREEYQPLIELQKKYEDRLVFETSTVKGFEVLLVPDPDTFIMTGFAIGYSRHLFRLAQYVSSEDKFMLVPENMDPWDMNEEPVCRTVYSTKDAGELEPLIRKVLGIRAKDDQVLTVIPVSKGRYVSWKSLSTDELRARSQKITDDRKMTEEEKQSAIGFLKLLGKKCRPE